jgi:hypothetical protein
LNYLGFLGVFYFLLGNIRPIFRSTVRCIQLIGIAKTNYIKKYGIDSLLEPFIKDVNTLAKVLYDLDYMGTRSISMPLLMN